jgi:hypothetical protein
MNANRVKRGDLAHAFYFVTYSVNHFFILNDKKNFWVIRIPKNLSMHMMGNLRKNSILIIDLIVKIFFVDL